MLAVMVSYLRRGDERLEDCVSASTIEKGRSSFLKKRTKRLLILRPVSIFEFAPGRFRERQSKSLWHESDLYVPALLQGLFGSTSWMARHLGAEGCRARTVIKGAGSRENGRQRGRPKKAATT